MSLPSAPRRTNADRLLAGFLRIKWARRALVALIYLALWTASFQLALLLRFEGAVPVPVADACQSTLLLILALRLTAFLSLGLFDGLWRYSGMPELKRLVLATSSATALAICAEAMLQNHVTPRSLFLGEWLASIVAVGGMRMVIRLGYERGRFSGPGIPTLVIGAGDAGESLLRELQRMRGGEAWRVVGFIDDDRRKQGLLVHHVRVLGAADEKTLRRAIDKHEIELIVLAMPSAGKARIRELVRLCRDLGVHTLTVPSLEERMQSGPLEVAREIDIEDLLGRDPIQLDVGRVASLIDGKTVLVTGAGGSIGSELARQVLRFQPARLLLLDHDENAIFFLERELRTLIANAASEPGNAASEANAELLIEPLIVDICDRRRVAWVFDRYHPHLVLHAAAHKHVAMMEQNACEAVRNNVFGTQIVAEAAHAARAETFVLISTDKAVRPTSVMGASKRICEMVVQHIAQRSHTRIAAVRFGNVLGSNGSVVPLFREQIARGGPVTVTHPEVTRYFMTIPEAAQLVLQAGALGGSGQILLLDMGEPVKILDLARDLIELSGLRAGVDIQIKITGLKPGEKIFEEMLLDHEQQGVRPHPQIVRGAIQAPPELWFAQELEQLASAVRANDEVALRSSLSRLVPEAMLAIPTDSDPALLSIRAARWKTIGEALEQSAESNATVDTSQKPARRLTSVD